MSEIPEFSQENIVDGRRYKFEIFPASDFSNLSDVAQSYGVILNDRNEILLVAEKENLWYLPGGTIEPGESNEDALIREVYEEAAIVLDRDSLTPFFYQKVYGLNMENEYEYLGTQVRYICKPLKIGEFIADKDEGKVKCHLWSSIDNLHEHLKWKETTAFIQRYLKEYLRSSG